MPSSVAVIGAGPAGLTAALQLARRGIDVEVFEAGPHVGGMSRSFDLWGQRVDIGPHRFYSSDPRVNGFWLDIMGRDYCMVERLTRIYYRNRFFDYPLKPFNALKGLGPMEAARCLASYAVVKLRPPAHTDNFEAWVTKRFGARLYEIFFKSYSEKLWGIPCDQLDSDFATQRIKNFSLFEAVKSALIGRRGKKHKTLIDQFAYPLRGAGEVYERMHASLAALGVLVHLETPITGLQTAHHGADTPAISFPDGNVRRFDHIVSTMPLTRLVEGLSAPADVLRHARALTFRNTILVYLRVSGANPFPDQWIYVHSAGLKTGRITNFSNWSPTINAGQTDTILCMEYWCNDDDPFWRTADDELVILATREIHATGLVAEGLVRDGMVMRVPKSYPVYAQDYKSHLKPIQEFLDDQRGITAIGRYGAFKYNNQDHSILMGLLAAENITGEASHDLWALNTDYEYQESATITATGLSRD
ncbi:FAD-dependent oxidoreductase [Pseudazoarcus pumilus]|uniref:Amine oxidase domain-containing protein n=1 Tax=Pseudazoarcus pumilus TaxID=2067960 RepID=A0A2I6S8W4_9RHOO|nr:FAD-dependent oxidoreductase [Pseudazoarcus pumilus]AUN95704.1 hypothetical protein C0099_12645 [Pseudazoarcus pumilus]